MKPRRIIGLDLGHAAYKLAVVEPRDAQAVLVDLRWQDLPPQADPNARRAALKKLLEGIPVSKSTGVVSIVDDPYGCLQQVTVPAMTGAELAEAIRWELQRYLAVPPEETVADYQLLEEIEEAGSKRLKLLAAALPTAAIRNQLAFLAAEEIRPFRLVPPAAAVVAWWAHTGGASMEIPQAILSVGQKSSEFLVVQGKRLLFARKIPVAGGDVTHGMTGVLMTAQGQVGLSEAEAEQVKREAGIPGTNAPEAVIKGISGMQLLSLIRGSLERLAAEVERSLAFYGESVAGPPVSELILIGGGAHLKGLPEWLQERLRVRVSVPGPLADIPLAPGFSPGSVAGKELSLIPALGAALGGQAGINLLPLEMKEAARLQVRRSLFTGAVTAILLGAALLRVGMGITRQVLETQIAAFRLEKEAIVPEMARARVALEVQQRQKQEPPWEEMFRQMSLALPREAYLTAFSVEERRMTLRGRVRDLGRATDLVLAGFIRSLNEGVFTEAQLVSSRQDETGSREAEFEIRCSLK